MPDHYLWRRDLSKYTLKSFASANEVVCDTNNGDLLTYDANGTNKIVVDTTSTQTLTNKTLTAPTITAPVMSGAGTITGFTLTGNTINSNIQNDYIALVATQTFQTATVLTTLTGFSWTLTAGATYQFEVQLYTTQTTNGGLQAAFHYTNSLTLTSIAEQSEQYTASTIALAQNTTTTDQTAFVNNKTAAYIGTYLSGTLVVNAGGTLSVQACQNTSNSDTTSILLGSYARFTRIL